MIIIYKNIWTKQTGGGTSDWLAGYFTRRATTFSSSSLQADYTYTFKVHTTSGTNDSENVYIGAVDIRTIRFTGADKLTTLAFTLLRSEGTAHTVAVTFPVILVGDNVVYLYYGKAAGSIFKLAWMGDAHYDTTPGHTDRPSALTYINNFVTRMSTYLPDLAVHAGDKQGALAGDKVAIYQATLDAFAPVSTYATVARDGVAPGNHDFEYHTYAVTKGMHPNETWMDGANMYGYWDSADYRFISLDANYADGTDNHLSAAHQGFGFINQTQRTWLTNTLADSAKPCIIFCHQPLGEQDFVQYHPTLTNETLHTKNRAEVRQIIENSKKVIGVISGHAHCHSTDVIKGIPYMTCRNITNDNLSGTGNGITPAVTAGSWQLIELNKEDYTITFKNECYKDNAYHTVHEQVLPFGPTSLITGVGEDAEQVYTRNGQSFYKASILRDSSQMFGNNLAYIRKYPVNLYDANPRLSDRTIRIQARTSASNYGRGVWEFAPVTDKFTIKMKVNLSVAITKLFKFGASDVAIKPAVYYGFRADGIYAFNGSANTLVQAYTTNTWYELEAVVTPATSRFSLWVNGVLRANNFAYNNATTPISHMELLTEAGDMFIDNLRIEKITEPKPSALEWSAEEVK
jgi:hypothetical protein